MVIVKRINMYKKYLSIFFCILHVKGDLIEIEIEIEKSNICQNPTFYRYDFGTEKDSCGILNQEKSKLNCDTSESCSLEKYCLHFCIPISNFLMLKTFLSLQVFKK